MLRRLWLSVLAFSLALTTGSAVDVAARKPLIPRQANATAIAAQQLANGIGFNILAQEGEVTVTTAIQALEAESSKVDLTLFQAAKFDLLTFVLAGISIREQNQLLAAVVNAEVAAGLLVIQSAQEMEFALASNLTGNPATDAPILAQLQMDFAGGIQKNLALQLLAIGGDNVAAATATSTPAGTPAGTGSLAPNAAK